MKNLFLSIVTLPMLALTACNATSDSLYRPSDEVVAFESLEQRAEFQKVQFNPSVDILFVIDDSRSMQKHISNLSSNIKSFVEAFASHDQIDFHIGVTTVWDSGRYQHESENPNGVVPQFQVNPETGEPALDANGSQIRNFWNRGELIPVAGSNSRFVSRTDGFKDQLSNTLLSIRPQEFVKGGDLTPDGRTVPGVGPEVEELFSPVISNLTDPDLNDPESGVNRGFWRSQSHKVFVFVTDADDGTPELSYDSFDSQVRAAIGGTAEENYSYYSVMHPPTRAHTNACPKDPGIRSLAPNEYKLKRLIDLTSGQPLDLCTNFGQKLADVGKEIRERTLRKVIIPLQRVPEFFNENPDPTDTKDWLEVSYGEQKIPLYNVEGWGWSWDPEHNLLIIRGIDQMEHQEGAEFSIDFTPLRLSGE